MVFPKFIIVEDPEKGRCLVIAKCTFHRQLACDEKYVRGGGWWTLDNENSTFTLYGKSHDFGPALREDIVNCIKSKRVFANKSLSRKYLDKFKFLYRDVDGTITNLEV